MSGYLPDHLLGRHVNEPNQSFFLVEADELLCIGAKCGPWVLAGGAVNDPIGTVNGGQDQLALGTPLVMIDRASCPFDLAAAVEEPPAVGRELGTEFVQVVGMGEVLEF